MSEIPTTASVESETPVSTLQSVDDVPVLETPAPAVPTVAAPAPEPTKKEIEALRLAAETAIAVAEVTASRVSPKGADEEVNFATHMVLQSGDDVVQEFVILKEAAMMCTMLKDMIADSEPDAEDKIVLPLPQVNAVVLAYIVQYCNKHWNDRAKEIPKEFPGTIRDHVTPWDAAFVYTDLIKNGVEKDHVMNCEVLLGANFLGCIDLINLCSAMMAQVIRNKTPQEIRDVLGIPNDYTPAEEAELRSHCTWIPSY